MKICFNDTDVFVYQCAYAAEQITEWSEDLVTIWANPQEALYSLYCRMKRLKEDTNADIIIQCISDSKLYRKEIYDEYKGNRVKPFKHPPLLKSFMRKHFIENNALVIAGCEADDCLGFLMTMPEDELRLFLKDRLDIDIPEDETIERCLSTIDKDLDTVVGDHYNLNSGKYYSVSEDEANVMLTSQVLVGDNVDNIPGITGFAFPKEDAKTLNKLMKALKANPVLTEEFRTKDWWDAIVSVYRAYNLSEEDALRAAKLVAILTYEQWDTKNNFYNMWTPYDGYR